MLANRVSIAVIVIALAGIACGGVGSPASNPSTGQEDINSSAGSAPFTFIPYDIKEETSTQAGYKDVKIYFLIENASSEWAVLHSMKEVTLKTEEGYSESGGFPCEQKPLLASNMIVQHVNGTCYGEDSPQLFWHFQIGETLHPSSIEFTYIYQPLDETGSTYNSPFIESDQISVNVRNLQTKPSIPFANAITSHPLPVTYTASDGTLTFTSSQIDMDNGELRVNLSATSSDPANNNYVFLNLSVVSNDGTVIQGDLKDGRMARWGVGPLQTLDDILVFHFWKGAQIEAPFYLLFSGFTMGDDKQRIQQIMLLNP